MTIESPLKSPLREITQKLGPITVKYAAVDICIIKNGQPIDFTNKERMIIALLISEPRRYFSRAEVMQYVWPRYNAESDSHTLETVMSRTRIKLLGVHNVRIVTDTGRYALFVDEVAV